MTRFFATWLLAFALVLGQWGLAAPAWALYTLDFGDSVNVTVRDASQYNFSGGIRPDGVVTVPFIGDVEAVGLTPNQLAERIRNLLKRSLRDPQVFVSVTQFRVRTVMVLGQVTSPGKVDLPQNYPTLLDVVGAAGGFTDRAVHDQVTVFRGDGPTAETFVVDMDAILKRGDVSHNIAILPGDRIYVPEVWYPDLQKVISSAAPIIQVVSTLVFLINIYNQASKPAP